MNGVSEAGTPANSLKRRKVATPSLSPVLGKETVSVADGNKQHSSLRWQSVPRDNASVSAQKHIPNITRNASLWDPDTVRARKVAVDLAEALIMPEAQTRFDQVKDLAEMTETSVLHTVRAAAFSRIIYNKYLQEAAESHEKISMLTQDLEEAKTEVKLEKISQEMAKRLVEQAKQEKNVVELKFTSEKACLKRKIQDLEMELQQQKDKFKDALVDAEVDGYNKCVKKAREMGLKYENLLLDHVNGPVMMQQEEYIVHSATNNSGNSNAYTDLGNATDPTAAIPTVSLKAKALLDPADPVFYRSMIKRLVKRTLEDQVCSGSSKKSNKVPLKPTSSPSKQSCIEESHIRTGNQITREGYKILKSYKSEILMVKKAAFILGFNKCLEFIGNDVFDPSRHSFKAFIASEAARLGITTSAERQNEHQRDQSEL